MPSYLFKIFKKQSVFELFHTLLFYKFYCLLNFIEILKNKSLFLFKIFQSASLCLTTTTPEQLASALWWFMRPLQFIGVPVAEITLTLLLSLRFISLVFDEVGKELIY